MIVDSPDINAIQLSHQSLRQPYILILIAQFYTVFCSPTALTKVKYSAAALRMVISFFLLVDIM